jgi:hypothetical protein
VGREFFDIVTARNHDVEVSVVDAKPEDKHLLLMVKELTGYVEDKHKFLCGHDEFHWFAKEALKPQSVRELQRQAGGKKRPVRAGVKRQGEWFFIPKPSMKVPHNQILHDEPIQRGRNKPHVVAELWRMGGHDLWVGTLDGKQAELTQAEYAQLMRHRSEHSIVGFRLGRVDAKVFGRGKVTHPDHSILKLDFWHEIIPNTEHRFSTERLLFID